MAWGSLTPDFPWVDEGTDAAAVQAAAEAAAARQSNAVRSHYGRPEGKTTAVLDHLGTSIYNTLAKPSRIWGALQDVPAGQPLSERPDIVDAVAQTATDLIGLPAVVPGSISPGALASGAIRRAPMSINSDLPMDQASRLAPEFYSAAQRAVEAMPNVMPAQQWAGTLANARGVKPAELESTGFGSWLGTQTGPVRKADVLERLQAGTPEIKTKILGGEAVAVYEKELTAALNVQSKAMADVSRRNHMFRDHDPSGRIPEARQAMNDASARVQAIRDRGSPPETRYSDPNYQLPGGENYREMLLHLPDKRTDSVADIQAKMREARNTMPRTNQEERDAFNSKMAALDTELERADAAPQFSSSHWDTPNVLAHVRMNDRMIDGKKTLHVEEVQSDWHQKGRKQGYRPQQEAELENLTKQRDILTKEYEGLDEQSKIIANNETGLKRQETAIQEKSKIVDKLNALHDRIRELGRSDVGVPDAPFKSSAAWSELAMKKIIRHAAENGYERVSWTPGAAQAARYDLSKRLSEVHYSGTNFKAYDHDGKAVISKTGVKREDLPDLIGKDAAEKLLASPRNGTLQSLSGLDLKVGGAGMEGFYDKILPNTVNKLLKPHGGKVSSSSIPGGDFSRFDFMDRGSGWSIHDKETGKRLPDSPVFRNGNTAEKWLIENGHVPSEPVHVFDIPESLRDQALHKGFPLFVGGSKELAVQAFGSLAPRSGDQQ